MGISAIVIAVIIAPILPDMVWPVGLMHFHQAIIAILGVPRVILMICIVISYYSSFLQYKNAM